MFDYLESVITYGICKFILNMPGPSASFPPDDETQCFHFTQVFLDDLFRCCW